MNRPTRESSNHAAVPRPDAVLRDKPAPFRIEVTARTMVSAVVVLALSWLSLRLAPVVLVVIVALFLVGTLSPVVEWLQARRMKRAVAIGIIFATLFLGFAGIAALTVPAIIGQVMAFVDQEPLLRGHVVELLAQSRITAPLADSLRTLDYVMLAKSSAGEALDMSARSAEVLAYLASAVFLALYMMIDRDRLRGGLYALVPRTHHIRLSRVLFNLEVIVGGYIRGQVLTSALMAAFTFLLLLCCGVKGALAIAVIAGLADVLPYVGVFVSVGLAMAAALSRGPVVIVIVMIAMLVYEELESRILVPRIYGGVLKLPPSMVLLALLAGGTLMGIPGALLALPVAAALRMLVEELRVELPGEEEGASGVREADARAEEEYQRRAHGVPVETAAAIAVAISEERNTQEPLSQRVGEILAAREKPEE
jgi:predicted PurR-regulated permease PerM